MLILGLQIAMAQVRLLSCILFEYQISYVYREASEMNCELFAAHREDAACLKRAKMHIE